MFALHGTGGPHHKFDEEALSRTPCMPVVHRERPIVFNVAVPLTVSQTPFNAATKPFGVYDNELERWAEVFYYDAVMSPTINWARTICI